MTIYEDVVFSPEVVSDIAEISKYIRTKNTKEAANKYIDILDFTQKAEELLLIRLFRRRW